MTKEKFKYYLLQDYYSHKDKASASSFATSKWNVYSLLMGTGFLILLLGCSQLQDQQPKPPQNYSPVIEQQVTPNMTNSTNSTNLTVVLPKPVLLPVKDGLAVYVMDTNKKGSSITTLNKQSLLINAQGGSDGLRILKTLKNLGIIKLDYLIITNSEEDNIAGISQIILRANPKTVIHSGIPSTSSLYKQYIQLEPNITVVPRDELFTYGDAIIYLIVPYDDSQPLTNDNTVVVKLLYGDTNILFTSDCGVDCETRIMDASLKSQILISNGGCDSLSLAFLRQVNPEVVLFSGIPCEETLKRIQDSDFTYLATTTDGDILITSDGKKYEYHSLKTK